MEELVGSLFVFVFFLSQHYHSASNSAVHSWRKLIWWCYRFAVLHLFLLHLLISFAQGTQGPRVSFTFDHLLFLHLEPHNNWPHSWPNMLHKHIGFIVNVLVWHPGDFSNEVKILARCSATPLCNCSPSYLIQRCSIRSSQSTVTKTSTAHIYYTTPLPLVLCDWVVMVWMEKNQFPESFPYHRLHEIGGKWKQCQFSRWNAIQ